MSAHRGAVTYRLSIASLVLVLLLAPDHAGAYSGKVIDARTKRPIDGAFVTLNQTVVRTDYDGKFDITGAGEKIGVRAYGYARAELPAASAVSAPPTIELAPFQPKALYLSFYGIGSPSLRGAALKLIEGTEINALVVDVKGDRGMIPYKSAIPLAARVGAQSLMTVKDAGALMKELHRRRIYTIARIVVFKDNPLATARRDLAVKTRSGALWHDRENLAWTDPFNQEVRDYNIAIAVEAAKLGFDEIQFDYVRFPDRLDLAYRKPNTMHNRIAAISGFLAEARRRLAPYNVFVDADIFGYVCWNLDDTKIGQRIEDLVQQVDYVSPMLYPSCFQFGIPGYRNPVQHPYEIVSLSLKRARDRTDLPATRFRPWLQAFRDYAFGRKLFRGPEIRAQISAAEKFGSDGWMLWNPHNVYSGEGLRGGASDSPTAAGQATFQCGP